MDIAVAIAFVVFVVMPALDMDVLLVWAPRKDRQVDGALQASLGIRRRTRLGR